ncbi:MAG: nucleoside-triphosphatase [Thermoprotei archaeon]|nr:nucleoside-triphosphatase [Thermoprotei archaeon]
MELSGKRGYYITGASGVGKTTIFTRIVGEVKALGCTVGGICAPEVRERGVRVGFKIVDIDGGEWGWLARVGGSGNLRIGKYVVVEEDAVRVGVRALEKALKTRDIVAVDEIGPMELMVPRLRDSIISALESGKLLLAVVHRDLKRRDPEVYRLVAGSGVTVEVTFDNRGFLLSRAGEVALKIARSAGCGQRG